MYMQPPEQNLSPTSTSPTLNPASLDSQNCEDFICNILEAILCVRTHKMADAEPARKKRRGGVHQRMQQAAAAVETESALESLLLESFASGVISGAFCHALMKAAVQDIAAARDDAATFPLMERLSGIKHNKNFQEALEVALQRRAKLMQPMQVSIPMKGAPDDRPSCSILLPHELLHGMYSGGGWDKCIVPSDNSPSFGATSGSIRACRATRSSDGTTTNEELCHCACTATKCQWWVSERSGVTPCCNSLSTAFLRPRLGEPQRTHRCSYGASFENSSCQRRCQLSSNS